jgi:hypothetical protein
LLVATVLGILIGRTIRMRDRQTPGPGPEQPPDSPREDPAPWLPRQKSGDRGQRPGS